jgi:hypothetical protein
MILLHLSCMRLTFKMLAIGTALGVLAFGPALLAADVLSFPPEHHPWGRFPIGSSKVVRTTSEALDEKGQVVGVTTTDTRTTLIATDPTSYTLQTDATVDVASRRITAAPQIARHGYYGELPGQALGAKRTSDASLTIDGRTIPCEVRQVVVSGDSGKVLTTLYYSDQHPPFVLRRETSVEGAAEEKRNSSLVEVVALDLPQRVRGELKSASYIKTTQTLPHSSKITLEVHCDDVPGGVVAHWASETDASGRVLRRSTLELVEFHVPVPSTGQPPPVYRRPMRAGKAARRMEPR